MMLVEADTVEEAFEIVASRLSDGTPHWSDWHNASDPSTLNFSGRWTGGVFFTPNKNGEPDPDAEVTNYLCYADDPTLAEYVIEQFVEYRMNDIREYQKIALDLATYKYDPYSTKWDMNLFKTKLLAKLMDNDWNSDTAIFDLHAWTPALGDFLERVKKNPKRQWLIPVDFHH